MKTLLAFSITAPLAVVLVPIFLVCCLIAGVLHVCQPGKQLSF